MVIRFDLFKFLFDFESHGVFESEIIGGRYVPTFVCQYRY